MKIPSSFFEHDVSILILLALARLLFHTATRIK
jgi:hypothetical protein